MPLPSTRLPWHTLERDAQRVIRPAVVKHLAAARAAHSAVRAALQMSATLQSRVGRAARNVQARLLLRISADLHLIEHSATRGYMLQALTLTATVHELTFAIGFIGSDDARAATWEGHTKDYDTFPKLKQRQEAVRATLIGLGVDGSRLEDEIERFEKNYRFLCMAKHGNPILQKNWGALVKEDSLSLFHGPFVSPDTTRQAKQVLYAATELVWLATGSYMSAWFDGASQASRNRARRQMTRLEQLRWEAQFFPRKPPAERAN